jgi:Peptidase family M23
MKRLVILLPVLLALQVGVQPALAWTWPVDGPVLRPFNLGADPYAGGQHRGVDIGATLGSQVVAPSEGTVSFAGTVAANGRCITIRTPDGYSVTLVQLGGLGVAKGDAITEGASVGTVGPSGEPGISQPHVHLGIRLTADPNGYLDPLALLPPRATPEPEPAPSAPETEPLPAPVSGKQGKPAAATAPDVGPRRASRPARTQSPVRAPARVGWQSSERRLRSQVASRERAWRQSAVPPWRDPRSFEAPGATPQATAGSAETTPRELPEPFLLVLPLVAVLFLGLAVLCRQLRNAGTADRAAAVFLERVVPAAENAHALRLGQEDRFVLDRDFERVLLPETKALPDLDRNDNSTKLVDVADDPRPRRSPRRPRRCLERLSSGHRLQARSTIRPGSRVSVPARCAF